jgi:energy-coupling factor transport system ATP-binding protein
MEEAENADRVMVMNDGVIIDDNTPKEIFKNVSQLKSVGLSVPQTTELLYALNQNGFNISTDVLSVEDTAKAIALCLEER